MTAHLGLGLMQRTEAGEVIEASIDGIGTLRMPVVSEP
jgi:hypothetical protein